MSTTPILPQRDIVHEPETGTYAMYLDGELAAVHPGLSLSDALDIANQKIDAVLAYAAAYDAAVSAQAPAALAA